MYAENSIIEIVGHVMIAFLFVFRAIHAFPTFDRHLERFKGRKLPFPRLFLGAGFATMLVGGVMVALDYHAALGASALIVFTVLANLLYHDFWAMEDGRARDNHRNTFCNNIAVMGGLLLVVV